MRRGRRRGGGTGKLIARARLIVFYAEGEAYLRRGDVGGARDRILLCEQIPIPTEVDNWLLGVRDELLSSLSFGSQLEIYRWACDEAGITSESERREGWRRLVMLTDRIEAYAAMKAANRG